MRLESTGPEPYESSATYHPHSYEAAGPIETGRLPESERFGSNVIFGDDVEQRLRQGFLPGGGP